MGPGLHEKYGIVQFNGNDFGNWKFRVEALLEEHEVKEVVIKEPPQEKTVEWKTKNGKCKSLIIQCVANFHLEFVKEKDNAFDMWIALKTTFERTGVANRIYVRRKLLTMKLEEGEKLENHFVKFDEAIRDLKSAGGKLDELDIMCHLFLTLPKEYDNVTTALETLSPEKLTLEFVKGRLLDEEIKKRNSVHVKPQEME